MQKEPLQLAIDDWQPATGNRRSAIADCALFVLWLEAKVERDIWIRFLLQLKTMQFQAIANPNWLAQQQQQATIYQQLFLLFSLCLQNKR